MSVWPRRMPDGAWLYGQVLFTNLRWWNKAPVGLAPLLLIPIGGWLIWYTVTLATFSWGNLALQFLAVQFLFAAWPSRQDLRHAVTGVLVTACITMVVYAIMSEVRISVPMTHLS